MHTVVLKRVPNTSLIYAPEFCPYKEETPPVISSDSFSIAVSPELCPLCKICTFVPDTSEDTSFPISHHEKEKCVNYLTSYNSRLAKMISSQINFLLGKNRIALIILLTANVLDNMLEYSTDSKERKDALFHYYTNNENPVCYVSGCPVYFSRKLTRSLVQVVGEAEWK